MVELIRHLHCDIFYQERFLLNGVEVKLRLVRPHVLFCLMSSEANNYSLNIVEATLVVRRAKINPGIILAHARTLAKTTAKYPLTRVEVKAVTLHSVINGETLDNVILGQ